MSRNPYHVEGEAPTLRLSVLAFLDILGYSDMIEQAQARGNHQEILRSLYSALIEGRRCLEDEDMSAELREFMRKDFYALKAFTDNIVISWPVHSDAESEFGSAFFKLGSFQFQMVLNGFFIRGSISVDNAYVDEIAVFGSALLEAHHGESALARDPRIILTPSAVAATKQHLMYYSNPRSAPHVRDVLRDSDGQWFLNYLECVLWAENEQGPFYEEFLRHKAAVETKLAEFKGKPSVWSKYAWVARYHNYFCDLHSHHFGGEHRIDVNLFTKTPSLIVDEES
ncbi:MAG: hypothetical protein AB7T07_06495 [Steroidobacteraceae bacterium]